MPDGDRAMRTRGENSSITVRVIDRAWLHSRRVSRGFSNTKYREIEKSLERFSNGKSFELHSQLKIRFESQGVFEKTLSKNAE